ncbi:MAG: gliding motility-associated C-terminal domain-containing protein [Lewinella sp.]
MFLRPAALFFLLLLAGYPLRGQECTGNLGENIFADGDFGSGSANILTPDPGIAPGFVYTTFPPPADGAYTITNNTALWNNIYRTWRLFGDNSDDPNGYMMLVNASFEPSLFYEQEVTGLCENTLYQFSADVTNVVKRGTNQLLPNVSFLLDGREFISTGFLPEDDTWKTFGFTFTTRPGETTLTLALRNNAPGGIGNDIALDNISFRACGPEALILPEDAITVCEEGEPLSLTATINGGQFDTPVVQWQRSSDGGDTWEDLLGETSTTLAQRGIGGGRYAYRYLLANSTASLSSPKCRIVSNVKEVTVIPVRFPVADTICAGLIYTVGESEYRTTGNYADTLLSSLGCDSIVQLSLQVVPDPGLRDALAIEDPSCSYLNDGSVTLTEVTGGSGPYTFTFADATYGVGTPVNSLTEGSYAYRVTDRYGCFVEDSVQLISPFPFAVNLGPDHTLVLGEDVTLPLQTSQSITTYQWLPEGLVDCDSICPTVTVLPPTSMTLSLVATSPSGCLASDSVRLSVIEERLVYIPTAFSPNGDGSNDRFTIFGSSPNVLGIASLRIYDRWGAEVFARTDLEANSEADGWDGNVGGDLAPSGTYVYATEVVFLDGVTRSYSGTLSLIR